MSTKVYAYLLLTYLVISGLLLVLSVTFHAPVSITIWGGLIFLAILGEILQLIHKLREEADNLK